MRIPCEDFARHILPAFRSLIAKGLIERHSLTQVAAAKKLGTTQAAISYYISSKRGERYVKQLENNSLVTSKIREIVNGLEAGTLSSVEVTDKLCDLCESVRNLNLINTTH
jgi:predicted transcriptional regulator